jgi:hypothetical protein
MQQNEMRVQLATPRAFGALWSAMMLGTPGKIDAAVRDFDRANPIVGAPYEWEDEGMVGAEELIGAEELVGSEEDAVNEILAGYPLVGAAKRPPGRGGMQVVQRQPERRRILMCPFGPNAILTTASANIQAQPQDLFRPDRLVVPSDIAFFFAFTEFKVGQKSALTVAGEVPCAAFTEPAWGIKIMADTANVGNIITITVKNNDASTRTFRAVLIGNAAV